MTAPQPESPPRQATQRGRSDAAWALVFWIIAQTVVLVLVTRDRPVVAGLARADALRAMAAFDAALAALLFPALVPTWRHWAEASGVMIVMLGLATLAAGAGWQRNASACTYLALWLLALRAWAGAAERSGRLGSISTAAATLFAVGGAVLAYASTEFAGTDLRAAAWNPVVTAWDSASFHFPPPAACAMMGVLVASGLAISRGFGQDRRARP